MGGEWHGGVCVCVSRAMRLFQEERNKTDDNRLIAHTTTRETRKKVKGREEEEEERVRERVSE